jgi:hypothetical protein
MRCQASSTLASFDQTSMARLVEAAKAGRLVFYGALPGRRGHIGSYLYRIAEFEHSEGRPPLTAIVVRKQDGLPGEGFAIAAAEVGYTRPGESDSAVWKRAAAEVFAYWRTK